MSPKDVALMVARQNRMMARLERGIYFRNGNVPGSDDIVYPPLNTRAVSDDGWVMLAQLCEAHIGWFPATRGWDAGINIRCQANNVDDVAQFTIPMAKAFARAILKCARLAEAESVSKRGDA